MPVKSVAGGTLTDRQDVGVNSPNGPQEGLPEIDILGAFEVGNSSNDRGKTANNNFYVSDALSSCLGQAQRSCGHRNLFRNQFNVLSHKTTGFMTLLSFPDFRIAGCPPGTLQVREGTSTSFSEYFLLNRAYWNSRCCGLRANAAGLLPWMTGKLRETSP